MAVRGENVFVGFLGAALVFYAIVFSGKKGRERLAPLVFFSERKNRFIPPGEGITTFPNYW